MGRNGGEGERRARGGEEEKEERRRGRLRGKEG